MQAVYFIKLLTSWDTNHTAALQGHDLPTHLPSCGMASGVLTLIWLC